MELDAKAIMQCFCQKYDGIFGRFEMDPESDGACAVSTHEVDSRYVRESVVMVSVSEDPGADYSEKADFIRSKGVKTPMGTPVPIEVPRVFDEWIGFINNFSKMGIKGGFIYCAGRIGEAVVCIQAFSVKKQVPEEETNRLLDDIVSSIRA